MPLTYKQLRVLDLVRTGRWWFCTKEVQEAVAQLLDERNHYRDQSLSAGQERDELKSENRHLKDTLKCHEAPLRAEIGQLKEAIEAQKDKVQKARGLEARVLRLENEKADVETDGDKKVASLQKDVAVLKADLNAARKKANDLETEVVDGCLAIDAKEKVLRQTETDLANANETVRQHQLVDARLRQRVEEGEKQLANLEHNHNRVLNALRDILGGE